MPKIANSPVIFFDLGDTLIYFDGNWKEVLQKSTHNLWKYLVCEGFPLNEKQFAKDFSSRMKNYYSERNKNFVEYTSEKVLQDCLNDLGFVNTSTEIIKNALNAMYSVSQEFWHLEEDAITTLNWLQEHSYKIGLISNASDSEDVYTLLRKFDITNFFEHVVISADFGLRKPHPNIFKEGLRLFQVTPENCFMVGDRLDMDILGANNVGITSIWITRRSIHRENEHDFIAKPDYIVDSLKDFVEIIRKN